MTKAKSFGIVLGIVGLAVTSVGAARAEGSGYPSAAALFGFGFPTSSPQGFVGGWNPAGFGLGARGGYTLPMNVYIGGTFVYHFGNSNDTPSGKLSYGEWYFGLEGGYEIEAGPVMVRPYLGFGDVIGTVSGQTTCSPFLGGCMDLSQSSGNFAIWPGGTVLYPIEKFFVGGDLRFVIVPGDHSDFSAITIFATGGMKF
jgi:hypothetical protein